MLLTVTLIVSQEYTRKVAEGLHESGGIICVTFPASGLRASEKTPAIRLQSGLNHTLYVVGRQTKNITSTTRVFGYLHYLPCFNTCLS